MNQSLFELYRSGTISYEDAIEHCHDEADFARLMEGAREVKCSQFADAMIERM